MQDDQGTTTHLSEIQSEITGKLSEAIGAAKDGLADKAQGIASEGKEALAGHADAVQKNLSSAIAAFSGAIRAASQHLANSEQRGASRFALEAAGGLERMSASLKDKPFEDVLAEIRAFGAHNPGVLVGGSVIAGLALGRFIKSSSPTGDTAKNDLAGNEPAPSELLSGSQVSGQEFDQ